MSLNLDKYFVMGSINCARDPLTVLEEALQAGITMFQFREKGNHALTGDDYIKFASQCQALCRKYKVPFLVNDDVELALLLDADGIHVGQDDINISMFNKRAEGKIIGVSVHTIEELEQAVLNGANYVGIGPIFATTTKKDAKAPAGVAFLKQARSVYPNLPIVAIGGITPLNSSMVRDAGANGVAVISAISLSNDIWKTVREL